MRSQWKKCRKLYKWCAGQFGSTAVERGKSKMELDVPSVLADLLTPSGSLAELLQHKDIDEGEKGLLDG